MIKSVGNWGGSPKRFSGDPSFSLKPWLLYQLMQNFASTIFDLRSPERCLEKKTTQRSSMMKSQSTPQSSRITTPGWWETVLGQKVGKILSPKLSGPPKKHPNLCKQKHHGKLDLSETWPQTKKCRTKAGDLLDLLAGFLPGPTTLLLHHLKRMAKSAGFSPPATHGRSKEDTGFPQSLETTHPPQTRSTNIGGHSRNEMTTWWVINQWFLGEDGTSTVRISCCGPNFVYYCWWFRNPASTRWGW